MMIRWVMLIPGLALSLAASFLPIYLWFLYLESNCPKSWQYLDGCFPPQKFDYFSYSLCAVIAVVLILIVGVAIAPSLKRKVLWLLVIFEMALFAYLPLSFNLGQQGLIVVMCAIVSLLTAIKINRLLKQ